MISEGATQPAVSVVIPAYNAARWIERTLACAQAQTIRDIEIIVVDDGSTDETADIVMEIARNDPRVTLLRQVNGGVARARNTGIAAARSDYVSPLDADDLWHPRYLESHLAAFAADPEAALVYSSHVRIDEDDIVRSWPLLAVFEGDVFEPHLCHNPVGNGSGITVRTAVLREIGGYSPELRDSGAEGYEDWLIQHKVAYGYRFAYAPQTYVGYRHSKTAMTANFIKMRRSHVLMMTMVRAYASDVPGPLFWWPQALASAWLALLYLKANDRPAALRTFFGETARNALVPIAVAGVATQWAISKIKDRRGWGDAGGWKPARFQDTDPATIPVLRLPWYERSWISFYGWLGSRRMKRQGRHRQGEAPAVNPAKEHKATQP